MPDRATLDLSAQERLEDARVLFGQGRYHGAAYICGYAVEFALKARICVTLDVEAYPDKERDFRVHELEKLLLLSGRRRFILEDNFRSKIWRIVTDKWTPQMRYQASSNFTQTDTEILINAVSALLPLL